MNYYKELLDSYSKLKKRSLNLKEATAEDNTGLQKAGTVQQLMDAAIKAGGGKVQFRHPKMPGKKVTLWVAENTGTGANQGEKTIKAQFGGGWAKTLGKVAGQTADTTRYQRDVNELTAWLAEGGEGTEDEALGGAPADTEGEQPVISPDEAVYKPRFEKIKEDWLEKEAQERPFKNIHGNANSQFSRVNIKYVEAIEQAAVDGTLTWEESVETIGTYREVCKLVNGLQTHLNEDDWKDGKVTFEGVPDQDQVETLRHMSSRLSYFTEDSKRGKLIFKVGERDEDTDEYSLHPVFASDNIFEEGGPGASEFPTKMKNILTAAIDSFNNAAIASDPNSDEVIPEIDEQIKENPLCSLGMYDENGKAYTKKSCEAAKDAQGTPGLWRKGAEAIRGVANEQIWVLNSLFSLYGSAPSMDKDFYMEQIDAVYNDLIDVKAAPGLTAIAAMYKSSGLGGEGLETLESIEAEDNVDALKQFITKHSGLAFKDDPTAADEAADEIIEQLQGPLGPVKSLAMVVALNMYASKQLIGDTQPIGARTLGQGQEEDARELGIKSDVGLIYKLDPNNDPREGIKTHMRVNLGVEIPDDCFEVTTAQEAFGENMPPSVNPDEEVVLFNAEVKTLNRIGSLASLGQAQSYNLLSTLVEQPDKKTKKQSGPGDFTDEVATEVYGKQEFSDSQENNDGFLTKISHELNGTNELLDKPKQRSWSDRRRALIASLTQVEEGKSVPQWRRDLRSAVYGALEMRNATSKVGGTDSKQQGVISNALLRMYMMEHAGTGNGNAMAARVFSSIIGSRKNIARLSFFMAENRGGITTDNQVKEHLINGLADGTIKVDVTSTGMMTVTEGTLDKKKWTRKRSLFNVEFRGATMQCRKSTAGSQDETFGLGKEHSPSTQEPDVDLSREDQSVFVSYLEGQQKLLETLLTKQ